MTRFSIRGEFLGGEHFHAADEIHGTYRLWPAADPGGDDWLLVVEQNPGFGFERAALAGPTGSSTTGQKTPDELPPKETAKLCVATAEQMQKQGHPDQAIFLLEKARENDPSLPKIAHHLALLYDAQGDGTRALSEYQKAVAATPKDPDLLNDFGYYHYRRGDLAEAEKSIARC